MHALTASPFYLVYGTLVQAEVLAQNERGWSAASLPNTVGATIEVAPSAVSTPTRGATTGPTQIEVAWNSLSSPDDGGSAILSYHLQYDNGTNAGTWYDVVGLAPASLLTDVIVSTNITSGTIYGFRVQASNIFGWGPYSQVAFIAAAREPDEPIAPVTSIDPSTGGVAIAWTAPSDRGDPITAYLIEIQDVLPSQGTWHSVSACNGADPTTMAALSCVVPMSILTDPTTLGYTFDEVVWVRVSATNSYGYGLVSPTSSSSGARIRVVPS
jgi:hypothetical protein